nr:hypothetical protein [Tanacetum cinerariifolium]
MSSSKLIICFIAISLLPLCFAFVVADEDLSSLVVEELLFAEGLFMALGDSDRDAEYALSRLLQRDTDFSLACLIEARFEAIAEKGKEHIIQKKANTTISLQSELASHAVKGSLNANEDIDIDEFSSSIDSVFNSGHSLHLSYFQASFKLLKSFLFLTHFIQQHSPPLREPQLFLLGLSHLSILKDGGGEFEDNIDEINLAKGERRVLCYVKGNRRRKRKKSIGCSSGRWDCALLGYSVFPLFNPGPCSLLIKEYGIPELRLYLDNTLRARKSKSGFLASSTAEEVTDGIDGSTLTAIVTDRRIYQAQVATFKRTC